MSENNQGFSPLLWREKKWLKAFIKDIRNFKTDFSFSDKVFAYRKGFLPSIMIYSGINKKNYKEYLSSKDYQFNSFPNGLYNSMAEIKLNIPYLLKDYLEYVPAYYFFKDTYGFLPLESYTREKGTRLDFNAFADLLEEKKRLCCKPCRSRWGEGFLKIEYKNNAYYINNKLCELPNFVARINGLTDYLVTEYAEQHEYAQIIYPESANTIRMLCIWDGKQKEFFLARTFHRFGSNGNVVDNLKSGSGLAVFIDMETGKLTNKIISNMERKGYRIENSLVHPNTGIHLEGIQIPNWQFMKDKLLEISNSISFLKYMGYDIVITENGFKILEINAKSGLPTLQVNDPLLRDERIKQTLLTHKK